MRGGGGKERGDLVHGLHAAFEVEDAQHAHPLQCRYDFRPDPFFVALTLVLSGFRGASGMVEVGERGVDEAPRVRALSTEVEEPAQARSEERMEGLGVERARGVYDECSSVRRG